jgi:hypothetical protein
LPTSTVQQRNHVRPITSVNDGISRLMKAITTADAADVPRGMDHFRRVLLPRVLEFLTDKLLDALKSKLPARRERAATALVHWVHRRS